MAYELRPEDIERARRTVLSMSCVHHTETEDAIQEGMVGLLQAAKSYDPEGKAAFAGHSWHRIRGAVRDAQRRADHLTQDHRRKVNAGELAEPPRPQRLGDSVEWMGVYGDGDIALRLTVQDALVRMEGRHGMVIRWWLMGVPHAETAEVLSVTQSRVRQLLREALDALGDTIGRDTLRDALY